MTTLHTFYILFYPLNDLTLSEIGEEWKNKEQSSIYPLKNLALNLDVNVITFMLMSP